MHTHCIFLFHIIQKSTDILEILAHISILMSFKLNIILIASYMLMFATSFFTQQIVTKRCNCCEFVTQTSPSIINQTLCDPADNWISWWQDPVIRALSVCIMLQHINTSTSECITRLIFTLSCYIRLMVPDTRHKQCSQ